MYNDVLEQPEKVRIILSRSPYGVYKLVFNLHFHALTFSLKVVVERLPSARSKLLSDQRVAHCDTAREINE